MLYLFNTTIMPNEGVFVNKKVSPEKAWEIIANAGGFTSAIGHQGAADALNALFPTFGIPVNRIESRMSHGDEAICLKLLGRLPEGQILDLEQVEKIGFELYHVRMIAENIGDLEQAAAFAGATPITGTIWER